MKKILLFVIIVLTISSISFAGEISYRTIEVSNVSINEDNNVNISFINSSDNSIFSARYDGGNLKELFKGVRVNVTIDNTNDTYITSITPTIQSVYTTLYSMKQGIVQSIDNQYINIGTGTRYNLVGSLPADIHVNDYVIFQVYNGSNTVATSDGNIAIRKLPYDGVKVTNLDVVNTVINENDIIIINGERSSRDKIKIGDFYTYIEDLGYWEISSQRVIEEFSRYTKYTTSICSYYGLQTTSFMRYSPLGENLRIYEGSNNEFQIRVQDLMNSNTYVGKDVEIAFSYLGTPLELYFGNCMIKQFGIVEEKTLQEGKIKLVINGYNYYFDETSPITEVSVGDLTAYTVVNDHFRIKNIFKALNLDDAKVISSETTEQAMMFNDSTSFDLRSNSTDVKKYKEYRIIEIDVTLDTDNLTILFNSCNELNEKGLLAICNEPGVRIIEMNEYSTHQFFLVFKGIPVDKIVFDGKQLDEKPEVGNINLDNNINIIDVKLLLQKVISNVDYSSLSKIEKYIFDLNNDNKINIIDVKLLLQTVISNI